MNGKNRGNVVIVCWLLLCLLGSTCCASHPFGGTTDLKGHDYLRALLNEETWTQPQQKNIHRQLQLPPYPRAYHLRSSAEIKDKLDEWNARYAPDLVHVTTSQETYQLPAAGTAEDCPFYEGEGCPNYIVTIQDFVAHPEGSYSSNRLPEVLWSGCLHGDERVGPTAVVEAADILLAAASCEALPKYLTNDGTMTEQQYQQQLDQATKCRQTLAEQGIDDVHRQWLARLVATRRIIVVPTANALGYFRDKRTENNIDPNRDFPYDLKNPKDCMQTIAARTLNEIYREHLFQLSLTFHAGMEVVGYEWGAPSWLQHDSPDDKAQALIASAYSHYAGGFAGTKPYESGSMNSLVYPVNGGMEDWAYAGSFDPGHVIVCKPTSYGGYPPQKTKYNNGTLRVFNMLVETSNDKTPSKDSLGTNEDVVQGQLLPSNGHVARNLRLALLAADLVEPYLSITQVNDVGLSDDIVPLTDLKQDPAKCQAIRSVQAPPSVVKVQWMVGGSLKIDKTAIFFAKWDTIPEDALNCLGQPSLDYNLTDLLQPGGFDGYNHGFGYFSSVGSQPLATDDSKNAVLGPVFHGNIDLSSFATNDRIAVVVVARVDQDWTEQVTIDKVEPKIPPQSHIVNARTNPTWHFENAGKHVYGRQTWYSMPLTIVVGAPGSTATIELSNRFAASAIQGNGDTNGSGQEDEAGKRSLRQIPWARVVGLLLICAASAASCALFARSREHKRHQRLVNELYEEENQFHQHPSKNSSKAATSASNYIYADQIDEDFDDEDNEDVGDLELKLEQGGGVAKRNGAVEMQRYTID
jgi:hypothetical protein